MAILPFRPHSHDDNVDVRGEPRLLTNNNPLAMVYGGGGVFGIGYGVGVAHGLAATGIAVGEAPALGTSAGSWVASILALGLSYDDIAEMDTPSVPDFRSEVLVELGRDLFGNAKHPLVSASAVCLKSRRRHILDGAQFELADIVAASSAVPGLLPPHHVGKCLYIDGGMWSATSVDAAANAERVIVVAPLAGSVLGPMGWGAGMLLRRELNTWRERNANSEIFKIRPNRRIAALAGRNPLNLFDKARALDAYPLAYDQGLRWGERLMGLAAA